MWDNVAEVMDVFDRDDFVKVKGLAQAYQNRSQLTVHKIRRLEEHEIEAWGLFAVFKARSGRDVAELRGIIFAWAIRTCGSCSKRFSSTVLVALFKRAPGRKRFTTPIWEVCWNMFFRCARYAGRGPRTTRESTSIYCWPRQCLHDIGKTEELDYKSSFSYTAAGQLVGIL